MHLLDSNTFIEAARLYYGFDLAPGFWTWLTSDGPNERIASVDAVKDEISAGQGALVDWAESLDSDFWRPVTESTLASAAAVAEWATDPGRQYTQEAVDDFLDKVDYWLIAEAMASGSTVVTRETPAPDSVRRIKIPDVCVAFGVDCSQPFAVYASLGLQLN